MSRPARWGRCAAAILLLGGVAAPSGPSDGAGWAIVAERAGGAALAARPLAAGASFALAYVHSAYRAPAVEIFTVAGRGFTMYALASPNEAVLDYYAVDGPRARVIGWWVQRLARPQTFATLWLITTALGQRTLVTGPVCVPLYPRAGSYDLRLRVMRSRPAGRKGPCPAAVRDVVRAVPPV